MTRKGWVLFVSMGVIWGLPYLFIKISMRQLTAPMLVEMRTGGAALVLVPIALSRGELRPVLSRIKYVIAFALAEMAVPWLALFNAERRLSSSLTGLLVAAVPLAGALLAAVTGRADRLDGPRLAGVGLGMAGVAVLVGFDVGKSDAVAALSMAVVVAGYAVGPFVLGHYLADLPKIGVVAASLAISAIIYAPISAFYLPTRPLTGSVIASVATLTVVCTALAFVLFFSLISEVGPVRATVITYVNPAVAVLLGVSVLGESFTASTGVGFLLIVAGCLLATSRSSRLRPAPGEAATTLGAPIRHDTVEGRPAELAGRGEDELAPGATPGSEVAGRRESG